MISAESENCETIEGLKLESIDGLTLNEEKQEPVCDSVSMATVTDEAVSIVTKIEETPAEREERVERESQIRSALNQQTIIQYRQYAVEQYPKERHKQEELIEQLQEQYFQQYITQVYEVQINYQKQQIEQLKSIYLQQAEDNQGDNQDDNKDIDLDSYFPTLPLVPANLWTRKDIAEFKVDILKHQRECCIKIGSLSTATVRVPTHPDGRCVFWEFATDYYDLGFGVYFEWNIQPSENITVHISESSDEEEFDEDVAASDNPSPSLANNEESQQNDLEKGRSKKGNNQPMDELIPVYRRDCHLEVYCGSHQYPGRGTYVLKFDNSYSVWRSKWLYYRVYYTK